MSDVIEDRAGDLHALKRAYLPRRYAILFYTLLLTMVAAPGFAAFGLRGALIEFFLAANLLAAVMPVNAGKNRRALLTMMALVWLARSATIWLDHPVFC